MKPDEAVVTPAPTREVVGELIFNCMRIVLEMKSLHLADAEARIAMLQICTGKTNEAWTTLSRLSADSDERRGNLTALGDDLEALMRRFVGEPNA
jgi:hypothetical protein